MENSARTFSWWIAAHYVGFITRIKAGVFAF
jgi:hypothetical protein